LIPKINYRALKRFKIVSLYEKRNEFEIEIVDNKFIDLTKCLSVRARNCIQSFLSDKNIFVSFFNMDKFDVELLNLLDIKSMVNQRNFGEKTYYEIKFFLSRLNLIKY